MAYLGRLCAKPPKRLVDALGVAVLAAEKGAAGDSAERSTIARSSSILALAAAHLFWRAHIFSNSLGAAPVPLQTWVTDESANFDPVKEGHALCCLCLMQRHARAWFQNEEISMSANAVKRTNARLALSMAQKTNLNRMVASASLRHPAGEVTDRLERLTGEFRAKLKLLGNRPAVEDWDRSLGSLSYSNALTKRWEGLSSAECQKRWAGVGKADRLLRDFCVKVAQSWTTATGRPLPALDGAVIKKCGAGCHYDHCNWRCSRCAPNF